MKKDFFTLICFVLFACSCNANREKSVSNAPEYRDIKSDGYDISGLEKDNEGFIVLFDGKSAKGWRGYGKDYLPPKWKIADECLTLKMGNEEGGDIIFNNKFKNFILELEWKIAETGNSGVFYLGREIEAKDMITDEYKIQPIYVSAPEYQLLDNENHPDAKLGKNGNHKSGSLYDQIAANPQTANPFGEWNKTRIEIQNGKVSHYLNGTEVVAYDFLDPQWIEILQASKFGQTKWPLAFELMKNCGGTDHEGYIGLQDHGDEVSFKNIRIKVN